MKKLSKKQKLITFISVLIIAVILAIVITTNIIDKKVGNESYLATTANANSNLVANCIKKGITIGGITGTLETIDVSNATATAKDVLEGKTFYAGSNEMKIGSMTKRELKRVVIYDGNGNGTWQIKINVKKVLPNVYNKLTMDNFGVTNSNSSSSGAITGRGITFRSYDQQNGILVVDTHGTNTILDDVIVVAWYVE